MTLYRIASKNMIIAVALIMCITLRLKLLGRLGSFFLKKYIIRSYMPAAAIATYSYYFYTAIPWQRERGYTGRWGGIQKNSPVTIGIVGRMVTGLLAVAFVLQPFF